MQKNQRGVSLVEALLVLIIGASILFFSLRQYEVFRRDADVQQVQANVDMLFLAMTQFYRANCYGQVNPATGALTPGRLNPAHSSSPLPGPVHIDINADLVGGGYLSDDVPFPISPLVDNSADPNDKFSGYVVQFNSAQSTRTMNGTIGTVVIWKPQVAVKIKDPDLTSQYLYLLGGNCLSSASGNIVTPCPTSGSTTGTDVVWERMPSLASSEANSTLWPLRAVLNQFTQMYTTHSTAYLLTRGGLTPANQTQYYLCGG